MLLIYFFLFLKKEVLSPRHFGPKACSQNKGPAHISRPSSFARVQYCSRLDPCSSPISSSCTPHLALCCPTTMSYLGLPEQITLFCLPRTPSLTRALLPCLPLAPYYSPLRPPSVLCFCTHTMHPDFCVMMKAERSFSSLLITVNLVQVPNNA